MQSWSETLIQCLHICDRSWSKTLVYLFHRQRQHVGWVHKWYRNLISKHSWRWEHNLEAIYTMCQATNFWKVEQPSQLLIFYTPMYMVDQGCPLGMVPEPLTCHIYCFWWLLTPSTWFITCMTCCYGYDHLSLPLCHSSMVHHLFIELLQ